MFITNYLTIFVSDILTKTETAKLNLIIIINFNKKIKNVYEYQTNIMLNQVGNNIIL